MKVVCLSNGNILKNAKKVVAIFATIYTIITILATISVCGDIKNNSTTELGLFNILSLVWFQIVVILFFLITMYIYNKKGNVGVIFELILGVALLVNVIVNILISEFVGALVLLNFVFPVLILLHALKVVISLYRQNHGDHIKKIFEIK